MTTKDGAWVKIDGEITYDLPHLVRSLPAVEVRSILTHEITLPAGLYVASRTLDLPEHITLSGLYA